MAPRDFTVFFCRASEMDLDEIKQVNVVGICNGDNGRQCSEHRICGDSITLGTAVRFLVTVVSRNDKMEYAIGAYRIEEGRTTCLVGFVPSVHVKDWLDYEDRIGQVVGIARKATSYGSCVVHLIPKQIGYCFEQYQPTLPTLKGATINPEHTSVFFGNKDAVKYIKYCNEN